MAWQPCTRWGGDGGHGSPVPGREVMDGMAAGSPVPCSYARLGGWLRVGIAENFGVLRVFKVYCRPQ